MMVPFLDRRQTPSPEYLAQDNSHEFLVRVVAFLVVQTVVFAAFVTARLTHKERDPWISWGLIPASYLAVMGATVCMILMYSIGGEGRHYAYWKLVDPTKVVRYLQLQLTVEYLYATAIVLPRIALCALYLQIFRNRTSRLITWGVIVGLAAYWIGTVVAISLVCRPYQYNWNKLIKGGNCNSLLPLYKYVSVPTLFFDVIILILPIPMVIRLHVSRAKKLGIFLTFFIGSLGIVGAIIRMVGFFTTDGTPDPQYLGAANMALTSAEPTAYFVCACFPWLTPLVVLFARKTGLDKLASSIRGSGRSDSEKGHITKTTNYSVATVGSSSTASESHPTLVEALRIGHNKDRVHSDED